jgi:hypothetical protein
MSIGKKTDFKIYHEQFFGGQLEAIVQMIDGFNAASRNALVLQSKLLKGDYAYESFMNDITLITRRDPTSVATADDTAMTQGEMISVKLNRKIGPVANTIDSFRKIAADPELFSFMFGQMFGPKKVQEMLNTAISALVGAIGTTTANMYTVPTNGVLSFSGLVNGLAKFGDQSSRITAWVMHSKSYFDLVGQAVTDKVYGVADVAIFEGTTGTLGRPVIVTDAPALKISSGGSVPTYTYATLGLVEGAAVVEESEEQEIESQLITGLENLVMRIQGEYAYNLGLKGYKYDVTSGGLNPDATAVALGTNWDKAVTYDKNLAGVRIIST